MAKLKLPQVLNERWRAGWFSKRRTLSDVTVELGSLGVHPHPSALHHALERADFLMQEGKTRHYTYVQKYPSSVKTSAATDILPEALVKVLATEFKTELAALRHNYGHSGTCTAFLLRKILEKLIFLAFAKNGHGQALYDAGGNVVGLKTMLDLAKQTKVSGKPFLMPKTADAIGGVKFLGDTAAHNPLVNVSMQSIEPQLPFIVTAYEELASKL